MRAILFVALLCIATAKAANFFTTFGGQSENFTQEIFSLAPIAGNLNIGIGFVGNQVITIEAGSSTAYLYNLNADQNYHGTQYHGHTNVNWPGYGYYNFINHPDGHIYAASPNGYIVKLDPANNFAEVPIAGKLAPQRPNAGAALGMAVDPQNNDQIYYVAGGLRIFNVKTGLSTAVPNTNGCFDGIFFNENGTLIATADGCHGGVAIWGRNGGLVAAVSVPGGPDGMAFHTCSNSVFSINNDGTLWRISLDTFTPTLFASGGSRGDIGAVGPDGCFYMNFYGSNNRVADGSFYTGNAVIRVCSGSCKFAAPPGVGSVCGDGKVDAGEECDGGSCCNVTSCKFLPSTAVCRAISGACDVAEYCLGNNATCPEDKFKDTNTPCGEFFGLCDVELKKTCPGNAAKCYGPPVLPLITTESVGSLQWSDFNVISFDSYSCDGGDVEGRLAVRNTATLNSFTLGMQLRVATDSWIGVSFLNGGDASWSSGSLYPDGTNIDAGAKAYAVVGGTFNAPQYLFDRKSLPDTYGITNPIDPAFVAALTYYGNIQTFIKNNLGYNANYEIKYGDGLFITCDNNNNAIYHVSVSGADLSKVNWYSLINCRFTSSWIIDVTGTDDVTIKGQPFPGIVERVVYNILGSGRTITANNGVAGHVFSPNNNYFQVTGVTYGLVIVGNVTQARQNNKPNCLTFRKVDISSKVLKKVTVGDTQIFMADLENYIAGDLVCINGDCRKIVSGQISDVDGDGALDNVVTVDQGFTQNHDSGVFIVASVDPTQNRDTPLVSNPAGGNTVATNTIPNGASAIAFSAILIALVAALF